MKHALILRLLNVPLFTALFGSLVMIGLDTMQGDKTAQAKLPAAAAANDSPPNTEIVETETTVESPVDVEQPQRSQPTVDPQTVAQFEEMLHESSDVESSTTEEQLDHVADDTVSEDATHEPETDATQTTIVSTTTEASEQFTEVEGHATEPVAPESVTDQFDAQQEETNAILATGTEPQNDQATEHTNFPADLVGDDETQSHDSDVVVVETNRAPSIKTPIAEGILRRRAERQRRLAEQARKAAEERRRQAEIEQTAAASIEAEKAPSESTETTPSESDSQVVIEPEAVTDHSAAMEIRLSNKVNNQVDVVFLLGKQVRKLAPGQTTIINQNTTVRFDRGGSFGAATEQLVLGRSYEFQVSARGWSVVRNPTVGNAATE